MPTAVTDGPDSGNPNLSSSFAFDFNTGFLNSQTDPNNLATSYLPEVAFITGGSLRLRRVTLLSTATVETFFDDPLYAKDRLVVQSKQTYQDGSTLSTLM